MTKLPAKSDGEAPDDGFSRLVFYPLMLVLIALSIWLAVGVLRIRGGGEGTIMTVLLAPVFAALWLTTSVSKKRIARQPPVFLPFAGAAPRSLPPAEALGPCAATLTALIERAAALREKQWRDVLHPVRRGMGWSDARAARRALEHAQAALGEGEDAQHARAALAAHIYAAFAADGVTPDMNAPSFVYAAGLGLMARDSLSPDERDALYGPFECVIPLRSLPDADQRPSRRLKIIPEQ